MKKLLIIPVSLGFLFLFSCENEACECTKRTYSYDGEYPTSKTEVIKCPGDLENGEDVIVWREDQKIDYVLTKTCI